MLDQSQKTQLCLFDSTGSAVDRLNFDNSSHALIVVILRNVSDGRNDQEISRRLFV